MQTYIKNHLENVRVAFGNDGSGFGVRQVNAYYPFGMSIRTLSSNSANTTHRNEYGYNGKMYQDELGLNWYDYGARFYDPVVGRWWSVDPLANRYVNLSPFSYTANNPVLYLDPNGQEIVIANNSTVALTNLAKIVATTQGRQRLDRLISSRDTYTASSTFWSTSSAYDGPSRTFYYVGSAWRPSIGGGAMSSLYAMGHELNHAYDHDVTARTGDRERVSREKSAINFANYLRSVYGDGDDLRTNYNGLGLKFSGNEKDYNNKNEKVTDFTQTHDLSFGGNSILGFSYNTSKDGETAITSYSINLKTESGQYAYRIFNNKKEYDTAVERIQNLKKRQDEK